MLKGGVCGGWSQVVFDTVRVPKLFLTDNQGRDGKPVWEVVDYEREVSRHAGRHRQQQQHEAYTSDERRWFGQGQA